MVLLNNDAYDDICGTGTQFGIRNNMPWWQIDLLCNFAPGWAQPLYEAVRDGGCDHLVVTQHAGPWAFPRRRAAPRIVLVGDDYGIGCSAGPAAFHAGSLSAFLAGCAMVVAVPGEPERAVYALAATVAVQQRRDVVLIETRPPHEDDWLRFLREAAPHVVAMTTSGRDR